MDEMTKIDAEDLNYTHVGEPILVEFQNVPTYRHALQGHLSALTFTLLGDDSIRVIGAVTVGPHEIDVVLNGSEVFGIAIASPEPRSAGASSR